MHIYDFQYGEKYQYQMLPLHELHHAYPKPGIYGWYLRIPPSDSDEVGMLSYADVFSSKRIELFGKANLGETYEGQLSRVASLESRAVEGQYTAAASAIFSPPIYIGRTVNVQRRLNEHRQALDSAMRQLHYEHTLMSLSQRSVDTEEESSYFGERIAALLYQNEIHSVAGLFVKVLYDLPPEIVSNLEYFLNRTYTPICGRK